MPQPFFGFAAMRAGLSHDTFMEAFKIERQKINFKETILTEEMMLRIHEEKEGNDMYERISQSISPEIFGMEEVKKALLLLLLGGVTKEMDDGMKIRGNVNVLLMGDPGVAKS